MAKKVYVAVDYDEEWIGIVGIADTGRRAIMMLRVAAERHDLNGTHVNVEQWVLNLSREDKEPQAEVVWRAEIKRFIELEEMILEEKEVKGNAEEV